MTKNRERSEFQFDSSPQNQFYESSKRWMESLKVRHDPYGYIDILDNDVERYPFQDIRNALIPAYQPSPQEIADAGSKKYLQDMIISGMSTDADSIMGEGYFDRFVSALGHPSTQTNDPELGLKIIAGRLAVPRQNTATVGWHPNIMVLPVYAAAIPAAFSRSEFLGEEFDLFDFNRQSLMPVNPALAVASFKGQPAMENISKFCTQIKIPPPTQSGKQYGMPRPLRKSMTEKAKNAQQEYLSNLYAQNKSAHLTIDPTASTIEPIEKDGILAAIRRSPVNRLARAMILEEFRFVIPITMMLNGRGSDWYIGQFKSLRQEQDFDKLVKELDCQTEELAGTKVVVKFAEREIGKVALR